jgi:hypothetical protein
MGLVDGLAPMVHWPMTPDYGERLDSAYPADEHAGLPPAWDAARVLRQDGRR